MTSEMMIRYMKWFREVIDVEGIIVYFFDRHKSHMGLDLAKSCSENGIVTIALPPSTTRITQPLDVGLFGGIKIRFKSNMMTWARQNEGKSFEIAELANIIKKTNDDVATAETIKNSFRKCGIFPWDVESIDFSRCLGKNIMPTQENDENIPSPMIVNENVRAPPIAVLPVAVIEDVSVVDNNVLFSIINELKQQNDFLRQQNSQLITMFATNELPVPTPVLTPTVHVEPIDDVSPLKVPEKPSRKGGRTIKALPHVVSSKQYISMVEEIEQKKQDEEDRKKQRRDDLAEKKRQNIKASDEKRKQRFEKAASNIKIKQEANEERKARKRKAQEPPQVSAPKVPATRRPGRPKKSVTTSAAA